MIRTQNPRVNWKLVIPEAARIAGSYSTPVTLRQLHYRLVAAGIGGYLNLQAHYKGLSRHTAPLRRDGRFPELLDTTRGVHRLLEFDSPQEAIDWLTRQYRRPRHENQVVQTWVIFEKATLAAQIESWVEEQGLPSAALRGYSSESLEREVISDLRADGRPAVVFYVGDLDPEGEDIERNFQAQCGAQGVTFKHWERLGVTLAQAEAGAAGNFNPGKDKSSRAPAFIRKYGRLFQIETEALDPSFLEGLVSKAIVRKRWFSQEALDESLEQEKQDRQRLKGAADEMR